MKKLIHIQCHACGKRAKFTSTGKIRKRKITPSHQKSLYHVIKREAVEVQAICSRCSHIWYSRTPEAMLAYLHNKDGK